MAYKIYDAISEGVVIFIGSLFGGVAANVYHNRSDIFFYVFSLIVLTAFILVVFVMKNTHERTQEAIDDISVDGQETPKGEGRYPHSSSPSKLYER